MFVRIETHGFHHQLAGFRRTSLPDTTAQMYRTQTARADENADDVRIFEPNDGVHGCLLKLNEGMGVTKATRTARTTCLVVASGCVR